MALRIIAKGLIGVFTAAILALVISVVVMQIETNRQLRDLGESNRVTLSQEIPGLKQQLADERKKNAELQDINNQLTDHLVRVAKLCLDTPPCKPGAITIRPTTTTSVK